MLTRRFLVVAVSAIQIAPQVPAWAAPGMPLKVFTAASAGTAFVVGPTKEGSCLLLTARHVIDNSIGPEPIEIVDLKGHVQSVTNGSFTKSKTLDLAFMTLASCRESLSIPLSYARGINVGLRVSVFGYPLSSDSNGTSIANLSTVLGRVTQYSDANDYDLSYDAFTAPGYSGGPVISVENGILIGMHGRSDNVADSPELAKIGGRGISAPLIYSELKKYGHTLERITTKPCFTGVCQ